MVKLVLIRGSSAVGKTTITKQLLKVLKTDYKLNCAYISEDDFRKQMQFKYKARDLIAHQNSVELIKTVILKLLKLDSYDIIFIEGQFRYKEIITAYWDFVEENNFELLIFQFICSLKERTRRDKECRLSKGVNPADSTVDDDIDSSTPCEAIFINTEKSIEESLKELISHII